jgi:integrase
MVRGMWVDPRGGSMTFSEWARRWLGSNPAKRARSVERDRQIIRLHLDPPLGHRTLASISPLDVQGVVKRWTAAAMAPNTVRRHYAVLRAILAAAVEAEILGRTPCRGVRLPLVEVRERRELGAGDVERLAFAVPESYRALIYIGAMLGLRWSEAAALRVKHLDLPRRVITVTEGLHETSAGMTVEPPKSAASRRRFTIPVPLAHMLAHHLAARGLSGADPDAFVFVGPHGGPLRYSNFRSRVWAPAVQRAGLTGLGFHDLRRAAATAMVASGVDVRVAQERLGHSDPRLTLAVYAQATTDGDRTAADRLAEYFTVRRTEVGVAEA